MNRTQYVKVELKVPDNIDIHALILSLNIVLDDFCKSSAYINDILFTPNYENNTIVLIANIECSKSIAYTKTVFLEDINFLVKTIHNNISVRVEIKSVILLGNNDIINTVYNNMKEKQYNDIKQIKEHEQNSSIDNITSKVEYQQININKKLLTAITDKLNTNNIFSSSDAVIDYVLKQYLFLQN